jgi:Holliday junction resolvase-like predicted endonuclease
MNLGVAVGKIDMNMHIQDGMRTVRVAERAMTWCRGIAQGIRHSQSNRIRYSDAHTRYPRRKR